MSTNKPNIQTCLSPALLHLYNVEESVVVVIDIFRATSTMAAVLHNGAKEIIPVASVEECILLGQQLPNAITAGERDGKVAQGLQYGNSPSEYPPEFIQDKTLVLTTTNGTRLLHQCKNAQEIIIGSFLNLSVVCDYLVRQQKPVLLACASWKDRFNLEDTLFAGAVYEKVQHAFSMNCDSTRAAHHLYKGISTDLFSFIKDSSHYIRLAAYGQQEDMRYCCQIDKHPVMISLRGERLIAV